MKNYLDQQITQCVTKINEHADKPSVEDTNQWYYWQGALRAYQNIMECAEELAVTAE